MCEEAPRESEPMTRETVDGSCTKQGSVTEKSERARLLDRLASFGLAEGQPPLFASTELAKRRQDPR